jgi:hypothetical protein
MNIVVVKFELSEALEHLQALVDDLQHGRIKEDDDAQLMVKLLHLLDHTNRAWNCRNLSWEEKDALPHTEFMRLSNTVPNYLGEKVIGEVPLDVE